jgi:hypothetical protein
MEKLVLALVAVWVHLTRSIHMFPVGEVVEVKAILLSSRNCESTFLSVL